MRRFYPGLLFAATFCLALGVTLPLVRVDKLYLFTNRPSLTEMIAGLWAEGDILLALLIALFSVLFPIVKLLMLHFEAYREGESFKVPHWAHMLSNWSMLDVVLVALVIFAAKTSGLANAVTMPGLWFFAAAAILTSVASYLSGRKPNTEH